MEKLSSTELYTWNFLEEHKAKIQQLSITQVAEMGHVSSATVVRTLKKKGFDGFSDYKNSLKHDVFSPDADNARVPGLSEEANAFVYKNIEEVMRTIHLLDSDDLEAVAKLIHESKTIMTISRGYNAGVCDDLTHRLQTVEKNAISRYYDNMGMYAERLTPEDMVLVISSSGDEAIIVSAVKIAQKQGAKVVVLTCDFQSPLAELADYTLLAYKTHLEKEELGGDAESTIPMELVSRVVVDMYLIYREKGTIKG